MPTEVLWRFSPDSKGPAHIVWPVGWGLDLAASPRGAQQFVVDDRRVILRDLDDVVDNVRLKEQGERPGIADGEFRRR